MAGRVVEVFSGFDLGANGSKTLDDDSAILGGFLAKATGTITVATESGTTLVDAIAVTAGQYTPLPLKVGAGGTVTLASNADGTLFATG